MKTQYQQYACTKYVEVNTYLTTFFLPFKNNATWESTVLVKQHFAINQKSLKLKTEYLNSIADEQAGFHFKIK